MNKMNTTKSVYLKVNAEDINSVFNLIEAKNKEVGKRKFSLQGLVEFDVKKTLGLTFADWIKQIPYETAEEYFNSKTVKKNRKEAIKDIYNSNLSAEEKLNRLKDLVKVE